jgi:hypothetical protein
MLQKSFRWGFPLLLFLLTQLSCDSSRLTLIIEATGVPASITGYHLGVALLLDTKAQQEPPFLVPDNTLRFAVTVPLEPGRFSNLQVNLSVLQPSGCRIGGGTTTVIVSEQYEGGDVRVPITMYAGQFCPLTIAVMGTGSISTPDGRSCKNSCTFEYDAGASLLLSSASSASSYPGVWGADCASTTTGSPCTVVMDQARRVEVTFPARPCSTDNLCAYTAPTGVSSLSGITVQSGSTLTDSWAVGSNGTIIRNLGLEWVAMYKGSVVGNLNSVAINSSQSLFVGTTTGAYVISPSGSASLLNCGLPANTNIRGISAIGNQAWLVGDSGQIASGNLSSCLAKPSGTTTTLHSVHYSQSNFVLAVGDAGTILKWDGTQWAALESGSTSNLRSVSACNSSVAWAVGSGGTILKWNGSAWGASFGGVSADLYGVWCRSVSDTWAVGDGGTVLRFDGVSWRSLTLPGQSRANLRGVAGNSISSDVWMVGAGAEIFRYVKP